MPLHLREPRHALQAGVRLPERNGPLPHRHPSHHRRRHTKRHAQPTHRQRHGRARGDGARGVHRHRQHHAAGKSRRTCRRHSLHAAPHPPQHQQHHLPAYEHRCVGQELRALSERLPPRHLITLRINADLPA